MASPMVYCKLCMPTYYHNYCDSGIVVRRKKLDSTRIKIETRIAPLRRFLTHLQSLVPFIREDEWLARCIMVRFACQLIIITSVEAELW
jgi:hypothetical protein